MYPCAGGAIWLLRTYRGKASVMRLGEMSFFDMTVDTLPSPRDLDFALKRYCANGEIGNGQNPHLREDLGFAVLYFIGCGLGR